MAEPGIVAVEKVLPDLIKAQKIDLVIAQAENVSDGKGITITDYNRLKQVGIDFFTGGNWSLYREEVLPLLSDQNEPIIRPANYPVGTPGLGFKTINKTGKVILVISLLGKIVGKDADKEANNPLQVVDSILEENQKHDAVVVNLHGDFSSEKVILGHYLDGRVTMAVGDHWHVPTADARVLSKGTAHITDVGMVGVLNASLGIKFDSVIPRWRDGKSTRNIIELSGPLQFNALLVKVNSHGLADSAELIQKIL